MFNIDNMTKISLENPIFVSCILLILIFLSGMFSGLTLGLMSLDESFLNLLLNCRDQIKNEVKTLLITFEKNDRDKHNFDIIEEIEEERVVEWLNELDILFKENQTDKINIIIMKIAKLKSLQTNLNMMNSTNRGSSKDKENDILKELKH